MPLAPNLARRRLEKGELALGFGVHHLRTPAVGMIAATLILPRLTAGWFMAVVAAVLSVGLLILAGANLLPAAALALAAVLVTLWQRLRAPAIPAPAEDGARDAALDASAKG